MFLTLLCNTMVIDKNFRLKIGCKLCTYHKLKYFCTTFSVEREKTLFHISPLDILHLHFCSFFPT
jgi:hypothetical protein